MNLYNRRANSINVQPPVSPAAGPTSGKGGNVMFNDTSATNIEDSNAKIDKNEVAENPTDSAVIKEE